MKLVILDESGLELATKRVSLIYGGVEIVIAGSYHVNTVTEVRTDATPKRDAKNDGSGDVSTVPAKSASVFSDSSAEAPKEKADDRIPEPDAAGDTGALPEPDNLPSVDKTGRGWDKRIDSSSKKIVKSTGIWARRKNIDDDVYASTIAELTAAEVPDALPDAPEDLPEPDAGIPDAPAEEAPLPDNNVVGDSDDDALSGILSDWG